MRKQKNKKIKKWDLSDFQRDEIKNALLVWIIAFTIYNLIRLYFVVALPEFEYLYYKYNTEKYMIINADVIDSREMTVIPAIRSYQPPLVTYRSNTVQYVIDGIEYTQKTYAYPDVKEQKQIKVAVNIIDNTKIKRCLEYH